MLLSTWPTVFLILLHIFNSIIAISHFISLTILTLSVHSWWFTACDFLPFIYALKYSTAFYFKGLQGTQMNLAEMYSSWEKISYKSTIQANTVCLRMNRAFKLYRQHVCLDSANHEEAKTPVETQAVLVQVPVSALISAYDLEQFHAEFVTEKYYILASSMSSSSFILILAHHWFERTSTRASHSQAAKQTHLLPRSDLKPQSGLFLCACAKSVLKKSTLNHTYQNCSNLSHSLTGGYD